MLRDGEKTPSDRGMHDELLAGDHSEADRVGVDVMQRLGLTDDEIKAATSD